MSTTHDLVSALKAELKAADITYADLAVQVQQKYCAFFLSNPEFK